MMNIKLLNFIMIFIFSMMLTLSANAYQVTDIFDGNVTGTKMAYVTCDNGRKWKFQRYTDGKWARPPSWGGTFSSLDKVAKHYCDE